MLRHTVYDPFYDILLQSVYGPFRLLRDTSQAIQMAGAVALALSIICIGPIFVRQNRLTVFLLIFGLIVWLFVGFMGAGTDV
jgi:hypothetical protein